MKKTYFLLLLIPIITELLEVGHFPDNPKGWISEIVLTLVVGYLVFIIRKTFLQLDQLARIDPLTGIENRRDFNSTLENEIARANRAKTNLTIIFFDVDNFKQINDQFGHDQGDKTLIELATKITNFKRKGFDYCFRIGGDEFALLLTGYKANSDHDVEKEIQDRLKRSVFDTMSNNVSISCGIVARKGDETASELLGKADALMYKNKRNRQKKSVTHDNLSTGQHIGKNQ
jgi:diguanylate cyclase (GGDEF)-like protein